VLAAQQRDGVIGDRGREGAVGRVGQVVPERQLDAVVRAADGDDHQTVGGVEAEEVRDDGEQRAGVADLDPGG